MHLAPRPRTLARNLCAFAVIAALGAVVGGTSCGRSSLLGVDADVSNGGAGGAGGVHAGGGHAGGGGSSGGGGQGKPCSAAEECIDRDACTVDLCIDGHCAYTLRDDDADGHAALECGGDDCNDLNPNAFPGHEEVCGDGSDNDCNGVTDCFDPACEGVPNCACVPKPTEDCSNAVDDTCDGKVDCNDPLCIGTEACGCAPNEANKCDDGFDNDCDGKIDCADSNCASSLNCQCQAIGEVCDNGADDDCDGLVDCADPNCEGIGPCQCFPPGVPEICTNGFDDDCDGLVDCADPDCLASPACQGCTAEVCDDGLDNNCDGKIDCADASCFFDPSCAPTQEQCNNGLDDDHDGKTDCQDPDCANNPFCVLEQSNCLSPKLIPGSGSYFGDTTGHIGETKGSCGGQAGEAVFYFVLSEPTKVHLDTMGTVFDSTLYVRAGSCTGGKELGCDDDSAGSHDAKLDFTILYPGTYFVFVDGFIIDSVAGPNEGPFQLNVEFVENPPEVCNDGIDNDGDHLTDCADPDCENAPNCFLCNNGKAPKPEMGQGRCSDGEDNDCDGLVDCADPDCKASDYYVTECCNGADDNGNGIVDDFSCRCVNDNACPAGQFCYTHTVFACGIPCTQFLGDVCPFIAPGSFCNVTTQQCEF
jgi:hypothetical protein